MKLRESTQHADFKHNEAKQGYIYPELEWDSGLGIVGRTLD